MPEIICSGGVSFYKVGTVVPVVIVQIVQVKIYY